MSRMGPLLNTTLRGTGTNTRGMDLLTLIECREFEFAEYAKDQAANSLS